MHSAGNALNVRFAQFLLTLLVSIVLTTTTLNAQMSDPDTAARQPSPGDGHEYHGLEDQIVNPADGSLSFAFQFPVPPSRGFTFPLGIKYSSAAAVSPRVDGSIVSLHTPVSDPLTIAGWGFDEPHLSFQTFTYATGEQPTGTQPPHFTPIACDASSGYIFQGIDGPAKILQLGGVFADPTFPMPGCSSPNAGSSYTHGIYATTATATWPTQPNVTIVDKSGTTYEFDSQPTPTPQTSSIIPQTWLLLPSTITDRNGNQLKPANSSWYTDTLGRKVLSVGSFGGGREPVVNSEIGTAGGTDTFNTSAYGSFKLAWTTVKMSINADTVSYPTSADPHCQAQSWQTPTYNINVARTLTLPNQQAITFSYDSTYGLVNEITYPNGGYVEYTWSQTPNAVESGLIAYTATVSAPTSATSSNLVYYLEPPGWMNGGGTGGANPLQSGSYDISCFFTYQVPVVTDRDVSYDGSAVALHEHYDYSEQLTSDGSEWTSKKTTVTSEDKVSGLTTITEYNYIPVLADTVPSTNSWRDRQVPMESSIVYKDGAGTVLKTVNKTWFNQYLQAGEQTILDNGQGTTKLFAYDANEQLTDVFEYGFQSQGSYPGDPAQTAPNNGATPGASCTTGSLVKGSPFYATASGLVASAIGPLLRHTVTVHHDFGCTHIISAPDSVSVYDGSNILVSKKSYTFTNTVNSSGATLGLVAAPGSRGNIQSSIEWQNLPVSQNLTTSYSWFDTGELQSKTDPCGNSTCSDIQGTNHTTQYAYSDSPANGNSAGNSFAYVTRITDPLGHMKDFSYDYGTGHLTSSTADYVTGSSTNPTTFKYNTQPSQCTQKDNLNRLTEIDYPDGGITEYCYADTVPSVTAEVLLAGSNWKKQVSVMDSMGHVKQTQLTSDGSGTDYVDTIYDGGGRVYSISTPYRTTSDTTYGLTTFLYDGLGRKVKQADSHGSKSWQYNGNITTFIDESLNAWQHAADAFGRLSQVLEPNGNSVNPSLETDYTYDTLNNLRSATQYGIKGIDAQRTRTFNYNSLSRLLCSSNPETAYASCPTSGSSSYTTGTIGYNYDANGNLIAKTDARGITVHYNYDALNRLTSKTYSNGQTQVGFGYDGKDANGNTIAQPVQNAIGRITQTSNYVNAGESFSYDSMGRLSQEWYCIPQNCTSSLTTTASYDLAGDMASLTYPDGRTITQGFDASQRLKSVTYTGWNGTSVTNPYETVTAFDAAGHPTAVTIGNTSMKMTASYDNRERIGSLGYVNGAGTTTFWSRNYAWTPNSNLQSYTDPVANVTRQFGYDTLNRLTSAQDVLPSGTTGSGQSDNDSSESDTNVLENAEAVGSAGWGAASASITPNSVAAPDGSMTATSVVASSGSQDTYIADTAVNPSLYNSAVFQGSVWLRVPSGTLSTNIYIVNVGNQGWSSPGVAAVNLTTAWQQFTVTGTNQNGLTSLIFQIGGAGTVQSGKEIDVWGAQLQPVSNAASVTNFLPYSQNASASTWLKYAITVAPTAVTAPDGTTTGNQLTASSTVTNDWVQDWVVSPSQYSQQAVTASIYLMGSNPVTLYLVNKTSSTQTILATKTVTLNGQWQRFQLSGTPAAETTGLGLQVGAIAEGTVLYLWGAQMETGSSANQYVPTEDVPVTATSDTTNILPSSGQITGPGWGIQSGTLTANTAAAPDGTTTADTATSASGSTDTWVVDSASNPSLYDGATVTTSVYARVASGTLPIDFFLIAVGNSGWSAPAYSPITLTTTWQRFEITGTVQNGLTALELQLGGAGTFTSGQSIEIWGAQMVMGSSQGTYTGTGTTGSGGSTLASNGLNQSYGYDAFGNMTSSGNFNFVQAYTADNRLSGWQYDASGNLLVDAFNDVYTYDAEGQISAITGTNAANYVYNASGDRVEKSGSSLTDYVYFGGKQIARYSGGQWTDLIYGPTGLLAEVAGTQTAQPAYRILDHLGTQVGTVTYNGQLLSTTDYAPFGQVFNGGTSDPYMFTGKERDTESGNDYFGARYYGSSMGRFMSPDSVIITPERLANPQELNLYAYVANNPLRFIDPTGEVLQCAGDDKSRGQCFSDLQQIAGDAASRLSMDAKTGVISFDTSGLDLSKNAGGSLVNDLVGSKNTYDFSVGPTVMTDKGPVRVDKIGLDIANLPTFGDQPKSGNPPDGVSDSLGLYLNNPNITRVSNTNLKVAPEWTVAFHELAEAYAKIDGGMGGSYAAGHNAALQRENDLRDQRPYLKQYNTGAGGPANSPNPQGGIIIKK
jgi:RHS repeat-associated protein